MEKYLCLVNCECLDRSTHDKDARLLSLQTVITKEGYVTTKTTELLLQACLENKSPDTEVLTRMNTDTLALLGLIIFDLSQCQRDTIRPTLNRDHVTLCASHVQVRKWLFGNELQT